MSLDSGSQVLERFLQRATSLASLASMNLGREYEALLPVGLFNLEYLDLFFTVVSPIRQSVLANDLDLDRTSDFIPFFIVALLERIVGEPFQK